MLAKLWAHLFTIRMLSLILLQGFVLLLCFQLWYPSGYIIFSDLDFGMDDKLYIERMGGLFNEHFSSMNFFNLSRLAFTLPFYTASVITGSPAPSFMLRMIIMGLLLLSAVSMFKLCERLLLQHFGRFPTRYHYFGMMVPALFYAVNPWVITRIQHIFLLVGYAMFPMVLQYTFVYLSRAIPSREQGDRPLRLDWEDLSFSCKIAFCVGIGSGSIHYFFYYGITISIMLAIFLFRAWRGGLKFREAFTYHFKKGFLLFSAIGLFCAYWLVPYMVATFTTHLGPDNVNVVDTLQMFSRYSSVQNVLYLVSYWWPMFNLSAYLDTYFWISGGVFLGMIGYIVFYRYGWHFYIRLFSWGAVIMIFISLGVNTKMLSEFNVFLVTKVPVIGMIFRDPNKIIGLLALCFAVLIGFAVDKLLHFLRTSGYHEVWKVLFLGLFLISIYYYNRPYMKVFLENFYEGVSVPTAYKDVQNHYLPEGKILWSPLMENMNLGNGLSNYRWNQQGPLIKTSGDFHIYSSEKPTLFQAEGNTGMISYLQSYWQHALDTGNAQHLGSFLAWTGFNELGFHQDVYGQEERQAFNKKILDGQADLKPHYNNELFTLYQSPFNPQDQFGVNRLLVNTKSLSTYMQTFDLQDKLQISPANTALLWTQQQKASSPTTFSDLIIVDNKWDMLLPQMDESYFTYPFDLLNTGNPYTGWAKTLHKEPDWFWLMKSNGIQHFDWGFDFGRGFAYTYSPYRVNVPPYELSRVNGRKLLGMDEVLKGFFTPENPDLFQIMPYPGISSEVPVLYGQVSAGMTDTKLWRVARSKVIKISDFGNQVSFLRLKGTISGIHAGQIHFKIRFFDANNKEINVSYVSPADDLSEFTESTVSGDTLIPPEAKTMRIDLLSSQDTINPVHFWIHDFGLYDISKYGEENDLIIPSKGSSAEGKMHVLIRALKSESGDTMRVRFADGEVKVDVKSNRDRFEWIDLGEHTIAPGGFQILPGYGLHVINAVAQFPAERFEAMLQEAASQTQATQIDLSLARHDFDVHSDADMTSLDDQQSVPASINNSILAIHNGTLTKELDILRDGAFHLSLTGNIPSDSKVTVTLEGTHGTKQLRLDPSMGVDMDRNFQGILGQINYVPNQYYLRLREGKDPHWVIRRYDVGQVDLPAGHYKMTIQVDAHPDEDSPANGNHVHVLGSDEIIVPPDLRKNEEQFIPYMGRNVEIEETWDGERQVMRNTASQSPMWMIYAGERIPVTKDETLYFQSAVEAQGLKDVHAKLMFLDRNGMLIESTTPDQSEKLNGDYYTIRKVPADGFVQVLYFMHPDPREAGSFAVTKSVIRDVNHFTKMEGTELLPVELPSAALAGTIRKNGLGLLQTNDSRFFIQNEAFNPNWKLYGAKSKDPLPLNLIHNGYTLGGTLNRGWLTISPVLRISFYTGILLSVLVHLFLLITYIQEKRTDKASRIRRQGQDPNRIRGRGRPPSGEGSSFTNPNLPIL